MGQTPGRGNTQPSLSGRAAQNALPEPEGTIAELNDEEELQQEQRRDHIGQNGNLLGLAGEHLDDGVGDQAQADGVADGAGNGHSNEHHGNGDHLVHVAEVHVLQAHKHQHAHVDQGGGGGCRGDDGRNGGNEDAGQEEDPGGEGGEAGTASGLYTGGGFYKGGDGGGAGAGPCHSAKRIGEQGLLHVGHIAVLVHHPGPGGGANQGADGVEHIDHAEGNDQSNGGEPADLEEALEVELKEGGGHHVREGGNKAGGSQGSEGIAPQGEGSGPIDDRGHQHPQKDSALDALLCQDDDGEEANEGGDHLEDHGGIAGAYGGAGYAGGEGAEEVPHHKEGTAGLGVDAGVGAEANVHQHQADGGGDAQPDPQGDGLHDLFPDVQYREDDKDDTFNEDDNQGGLEAGHVGHSGEAGDVGHHHSEKAVEAHSRGQGKGLVGQEGHAEHGKGGRQAGRHKDAVPQGGAHIKVGEQVGIQGDDIGHRHEGGETGDDLGADRGAVLFQLEELLHKKQIPSCWLRGRKSDLLSYGLGGPPAGKAKPAGAVSAPGRPVFPAEPGASPPWPYRNKENKRILSYSWRKCQSFFLLWRFFVQILSGFPKARHFPG